MPGLHFIYMYTHTYAYVTGATKKKHLENKKHNIKFEIFP